MKKIFFLSLILAPHSFISACESQTQKLNQTPILQVTSANPISRMSPLAKRIKKTGEVSEDSPPQNSATPSNASIASSDFDFCKSPTSENSEEFNKAMHEYEVLRDQLIVHLRNFSAKEQTKPLFAKLTAHFRKYKWQTQNNEISAAAQVALDTAKTANKTATKFATHISCTLPNHYPCAQNHANQFQINYENALTNQNYVKTLKKLIARNDSTGSN